MGETQIMTRHGFSMIVDLGEWIGQHIYMTGDFEPSTARLLHSRLRDGDIAVDVGANIGFFTLVASQRVGPSGKVYAFEPVPSTNAALRDNLRINSAGNVVVHQVALSNCDGMVTIYEGPARNKGLSSMRRIDDAARELNVPSAALDHIDLDTGPIRLVKIDVEGAEQLVIEGMVECLKRWHPWLIVEITDGFLARFGHSALSLSGKLRELGYRMYEINDDGITLMPEAPDAWPKQFNAFFSAEVGENCVSTRTYAT
jgi:FkbM family methyltransferase